MSAPLSESSDRAFSATEIENTHALIKLGVADTADVETFVDHVYADNVQPFDCVAGIGRAVFCGGDDCALSDDDATIGGFCARASSRGSSTAAAGGEIVTNCEDGSSFTCSISWTTRLLPLLYNYCMNFFL